MFTSWPTPSIRSLECVCGQGVMYGLSSTQAHGLSLWIKWSNTWTVAGVWEKLDINSLSPPTPKCFMSSFVPHKTLLVWTIFLLQQVVLRWFMLLFHLTVALSQTTWLIKHAPAHGSWCLNYSLLSKSPILSIHTCIFLPQVKKPTNKKKSKVDATLSCQAVLSVLPSNHKIEGKAKWIFPRRLSP